MSSLWPHVSPVGDLGDGEAVELGGASAATFPSMGNYNPADVLESSMSPTSIPKSSLWWSWGILAFVCAAFGLAYARNAPSSKDVAFDVVCESFVSPGYLTLHLKQDPTELASVTGYDLYGSISGASSISFGRDHQKAVSLQSSMLTLQADEDKNHLRSYLSLTRQGTIGGIALDVEPGVALSSAGSPGEAPALALVSRARNDVKLTMSSKQISVDGARYTIPEVQREQIESFQATLEGKDLLSVQISSGDRPPDRGGSPVRLAFKTYQGNLPLLKSPKTLQRVSLTFDRALNPYLLVENKSAEAVTSDRKTDLVIDCESATVDSIAIMGDPEKREAATLHIKGSGRARSMRQDGNQLLPTRLHEILDKPVAERTGWLILLCVLAAVLLKAADHALGILLDWAIPKG
jgi:hypothetical protein